MKEKKTLSAEAARIKMADLCARGEHCSFEISEKLRKAGLPASDIREVVDFLTERRFIDDERFAHSFANDKVRFSGWGRNKIRLGLAAKRIHSQTVADALADIDPGYYADALRRAADAKARGLNLSDRGDAMKFYRHMLSRGFESHLVSKELARLRKSEE